MRRKTGASRKPAKNKEWEVYAPHREARAPHPATPSHRFSSESSNVSGSSSSSGTASDDPSTLPLESRARYCYCPHNSSQHGWNRERLVRRAAWLQWRSLALQRLTAQQAAADCENSGGKTAFYLMPDWPTSGLTWHGPRHLRPGKRQIFYGLRSSSSALALSIEWQPGYSSMIRSSFSMASEGRSSLASSLASSKSALQAASVCG